MSDVKHIKEVMQLIESIQGDKEVIVEGRHDDNFKQAVIGIKNLVKDSPISNVLEIAIDTVEKTFFRIIKQDGFKRLPSSWKLFLSDMAMSSLYGIVMDEIEQSKEDTGIKVGKLKQKIDKLKQKNGDLNDVFEGSISLMRYAELLYHYNGISYQKIKDANPYDQTISFSFKTTLSRLEDEFKKLSTELIDIDDDDVELVLDMGQYKWYLLDRESCGLEGEAMGHCGNTGSPKSGDQILSLRQIIKQDEQEYYRPSLTFIINDGILGEMKGRANNKPDKKYHPYIMGLLKLPMIKGIRGGGYKPEANFDLADLTEEQRKELVEIKGEEFLERVSTFKTISKKYKETGIMTNSMYEDLEYSLHEDHGLGLGEITLYNGKLVFDVEDLINATGYKGYVFDGDYFDIDAPEVDDYDSYLEYLNEADYDAVVAYIMNNHEEDIKEYIENEYSEDEEEYGLTFVRNNIHDIIENIDIEPIKDAVQTALLYAYESGTYSQIYETMRKALTELSDEYSITIPTDALYRLAEEDKYLCIIEPDNFMAFIEAFLYDEGEIKLDFEEPYYGFYEFDEDYFKNEALREQLVEHDVLEPRKRPDVDDDENPT